MGAARAGTPTATAPPAGPRRTARAARRRSRLHAGGPRRAMHSGAGFAERAGGRRGAGGLPVRLGQPHARGHRPSPDVFPGHGGSTPTAATCSSRRRPLAARAPAAPGPLLQPARLGARTGLTLTRSASASAGASAASSTSNTSHRRSASCGGAPAASRAEGSPRPPPTPVPRRAAAAGLRATSPSLAPSERAAATSRPSEAIPSSTVTASGIAGIARNRPRPAATPRAARRRPPPRAARSRPARAARPGRRGAARVEAQPAAQREHQCAASRARR